MNPSRMPPRLKAAAAGLLLCAGAVLAACTSDQTHDYLGHSDRVTNGAGDAVASNKAVHTIDPWPRHSSKTDIEMDGKRAGIAAKRYESNTSISPKGLSSEPAGGDNGQKK
jgi:hypothetical protein